MKLDIGTLGKAPCERNLISILNEIGDGHISHRCLLRLNKADQDLTRLRKYVLPHDREFFSACHSLFRERHLLYVDMMQGSIPAVVFTHLRCCVVALFNKKHHKK